METLISKLDAAFIDLQNSNDKGKITILKPKPHELQIKVMKIGTYRLYADPDQLYVYLQSP